MYNSLFYPINKRSQILTSLLFPNSFYIEENKNFSVEHIKAQLNNYSKIFLQGYFQKAEYFEGIKNELRKEITINKSLSSIARHYLEEIVKNNSVTVHIRRKELKETVPLQFYIDSINHIKDKIDKPKFYIFSDDVKWCKENLSNTIHASFIEKTNNQIEDFWLICNCKHFIISNSTFSWWGAWLSKHEAKIVIAPSNIYWDNKDIIPNNW